MSSQGYDEMMMELEVIEIENAAEPVVENESLGALRITNEPLGECSDDPWITDEESDAEPEVKMFFDPYHIISHHTIP